MLGIATLSPTYRTTVLPYSRQIQDVSGVSTAVVTMEIGIANFHTTDFNNNPENGSSGTPLTVLAGASNRRFQEN
jgi:hypothetical protein